VAYFDQNNESSILSPFQSDSSLELSGFNVGSNPWIGKLTGSSGANKSFFSGFNKTEKMAMLGVGVISVLVVSKWYIKK